MDYYCEIKNELLNNEVYKKIKDYSKNRNDLSIYYNVDKLLIEAQGGESRAKYGDGLIREYSQKLTLELNKNYGERNLRSMRQFYLLFQNQKWNALCAKLTWSHYRELIWFNDINKINYYIKVVEEQNLSVHELHSRIKNKEYDRLDDKTNEKLANNEEILPQDFIKNPILVRNNYNYDDISEKILKKLIPEDLDNFLLELGDVFTYIRNDYKIKLGDRYNYIDMLLYNIRYNCYTVVEFKVTELKSEYIGQIQKYMNYIDKNIRTINQDKTIGIIICKKDNVFVMEYCSDDRIYRTTYVLN